MLEDILHKLNITGTPARVYMKLIELGSSSARRLAEVLSLPRPSVYDALKLLSKQDLVVEHIEDNKKMFNVNDPNILSQNLTKKAEELSKANQELQKILPTLSKQTETVEPKIKFYNGKEGIHKMINEVLWNRNKVIHGVLHIKELIDLVGEDWFKKWHDKREEREIAVKIVWPQDKTVEYDWLYSGKTRFRDIRVLSSKDTTWNMGYWVFDDKVILLSSRKELFGFTVQSKDFAGLMKAQFNVLWKQSKVLSSKD
jgi:sugar-specific transcriptional regulator TrmB